MEGEPKNAREAVAFGLLMAAFAVGNLVDFLLAGALPRPDGRIMRFLLIALLAVFGVVTATVSKENLRTKTPSRANNGYEMGFSAAVGGAGLIDTMHGRKYTGDHSKYSTALYPPHQ